MTEENRGELSQGIEKPHDNDVLFGRGGNINNHPGNETFRKIVETKKRAYLTAQFKRDKREIADCIQTAIRNLDPPGRFLAKDSTGLWHDVGYEKARDKTSQALRENAPSIRKKIEDENIALRDELQKRKEQEHQDYPQHPTGQQMFACGEDMNPLPHEPQEAIQSPDPIAYHSDSGYYNNNRILRFDYYERNHCNPVQYEEFVTDYRLPTDSEYGMKMTGKNIKAGHNSRPQSLPNLNNDYDNYGCIAGMLGGDFTPRTCSAGHNNHNGEVRESNLMNGGNRVIDPRPKLDPIACENESRTPAPFCGMESMSCGVMEPFSWAFTNCVGSNDDDAKMQNSILNSSVQSMDIDSPKREESNGSIGGASLVHVFDNDEMR